MFNIGYLVAYHNIHVIIWQPAQHQPGVWKVHRRVLKNMLHPTSTAVQWTPTYTRPVWRFYRCLNISPSETDLSRPVRTTLPQLHSGYCQQLNSYTAHIFSGTSDLYPEGGMTAHAMSRLWLSKTCNSSNCWDQPAKAVDFVYFISYKIWLPDNMTRPQFSAANFSKFMVQFDKFHGWPWQVFHI